MGTDPDNYNVYKKEYEGLKNTFNPVKFNPELWAEAAQKAGMKYVVFTTKHHDGFCMFDSQFTDYKITDPACPFSSNPKSNITKEIFDAFRKEGLWTGAYFSKPDWHSPYYWSPKYPPRDRNVNYEPEVDTATWNRYTDFTHNQIIELLSDYGQIDILWLDGGWVARQTKSDIEAFYQEELDNTTNGYLKRRIINQDIRMDELVAKAREKQPDLIVVDRAVYGKNQNYLTPENRVPEEPLPYPWESCIISGGGWSYTPDAEYMSGREGIQLLVDIVAKGGNLLLNIAPSPEGEWQSGAYELLEAYGEWLNINGEGIYNSQVLPPYKEGEICMTQNPNGSAYFFCPVDEGKNLLPAEIIIHSHQPSAGAELTLLGFSKPLSWSSQGQGFKVAIPEELRNNPPCSHIWTIKVSKVQ
jgi:alpha-L-fucosidase